MKPQRLVRCPVCRREHLYDTASPYRPFCSERCRLIDLGAWSQETYFIRSEENDDVADTAQ